MSHDVSVENFSDPCVNCEADRYQLVVPPSEQDHRQGTLNARVVLVEYGDYQCPRCSELHTSIQAIQRQLGVTLFERNSLCFIFRHFPQPQIHPQAQKAAAAQGQQQHKGSFGRCTRCC